MAFLRAYMREGRCGKTTDMHPKKVTVLKVTGVELVTLSYF